MYFGLIYDKKFIKNDRDFYGDAIIYFHPQESKEKVNQISYSVSVRSSVLTTDDSLAAHFDTRCFSAYGRKKNE